MFIDRGLDKADMVHIYNRLRLIHNKKNKTMPFTVTWTDLEIVPLSEASHTEKDTYHMI